MTSHPVLMAALQTAVAEGVFPGAVIQVRCRGEVVAHAAVGRTTYETAAPAVTLQTVYDLASLTKPLATATALMQLVSEGAVDLEQSIETILHELRNTPVGASTVEHLLSHSSGLPGWRPYYEQLVKRTGQAGSRPPKELAQRLVLEMIRAEPLESLPGSQSLYSDLGFMLLGILVERVTQTSLDTWCRDRVWKVLGIPSVDFIAGETDARTVFGRSAILAPTEQDSWRGRLLVGEVHDENAFALGGVAGHAGLFGTAQAVGELGQWWLNGWHGRTTHPSCGMVRRFTARATRIPGSSRALGWDTPSPPSSSGQYFSEQSFGHLGFTGTSLWIDPTRELIVALLSNRVHPTRANDKIKAFRPRFHDLVWREWGMEM